MKWIPIDKAKPKFKQLYILADKDGIFTALATLSSKTESHEGLKYGFTTDEDSPRVVTAEYIAAVSDPREKE